MLSFYQSLSMAVLTSLGFGALMAQRLAGDTSLGSVELSMFFLWMLLAIYLTVDAYKLDMEISNEVADEEVA